MRIIKEGNSYDMAQTPEASSSSDLPHSQIHYKNPLASQSSLNIPYVMFPFLEFHGFS